MQSRKVQNLAPRKEVPSYTGMAIKIKTLLNDIIDVAFQDSVTHKMLGQFKRFTISCLEEPLKSKLGDIKENENRSSRIRIFGVKSIPYQDTLIVAIHEASHHIDRSINGKSGHGSEFYRIHKKLLFAAFDMGVLTVKDVVNSETPAQNRNKLAKMMDEYHPHPIAYKENKVRVFVCNAFHVKESIKKKGYKWDKQNSAWTKVLDKKDMDKEKEFLISLGLKESDLKVTSGISANPSLRRNVRLFNVPYEANDIVRSFGYRWTGSGNQKFWQKKIESGSLPKSEKDALEKIRGINIVIC